MKGLPKLSIAEMDIEKEKLQAISEMRSQIASLAGLAAAFEQRRSLRAG